MQKRSPCPLHQPPHRCLHLSSVFFLLRFWKWWAADPRLACCHTSAVKNRLKRLEQSLRGACYVCVKMLPLWAPAMSPESNGTVTQLVRFGRDAAPIFLTHTHTHTHTHNTGTGKKIQTKAESACTHTHTFPPCTPKQTPFHSTTHARLYLPRSYCAGASSPALFFPLCFTLHYPPIHLQCAVISPSISSPSQSSSAMGLCPFIIHGVVLMAQAAMSDVNLCASKAHSASTRLGREGYRSSCRAQVPYSTKSTRSITPGSHSKCKFSAPLSAAADSSTFFL